MGRASGGGAFEFAGAGAVRGEVGGVEGAAEVPGAGVELEAADNLGGAAKAEGAGFEGEAVTGASHEGGGEAEADAGEGDVCHCSADGRARVGIKEGFAHERGTRGVAPVRFGGSPGRSRFRRGGGEW